MSKQNIAEMNIGEIVNFVSGLPKQVGSDVIIPLTKRLYEIALLENHTSDQERNAASRLLPSVKEVAENGLKNNPEAFAKYREAIQASELEARFVGCGSLAWLITEKNIPDEQIIEFVTRREYRHLLPDFIAILENSLRHGNEELRSGLPLLKKALEETFDEIMSYKRK